MDSRLETNHCEAVLASMLDQVVQHQLADPPSSEGRSHVHALDLRVLRPDEQHAAAAGRTSVVARYEEVNAVAQQLLDAEAVTALDGIETREVSVELPDERHRVRGVRSLLGNDDGQAWPPGGEADAARVWNAHSARAKR